MMAHLQKACDERQGWVSQMISLLGPDMDQEVSLYRRSVPHNMNNWLPSFFRLYIFYTV